MVCAGSCFKLFDDAVREEWQKVFVGCHASAAPTSASSGALAALASELAGPVESAPPANHAATSHLSLPV